ncbi:hypothetical protein RHODO2019_02845 [Rhodococcus antarcticus]|uniref:Uncharacterized protein n=1 Tax=Rhodococcus antarcticus TaxID=2987751 RepID=A0ABY6P266_9NOCA|nr:hypothetical protein [Rhodococcus antarcticus]UZJ25431.1 hypothetical protein RHODO2019_02845 [Rhodococcus antarcticus]
MSITAAWQGATSEAVLGRLGPGACPPPRRPSGGSSRAVPRPPAPAPPRHDDPEDPEDPEDDVLALEVSSLCSDRG